MLRARLFRFETAAGGVLQRQGGTMSTVVVSKEFGGLM